MYRLSFLLCWWPLLLPAQDFTARLDRMLEANFTPDAPGISLLVYQEDRVLYARQRGLAELSHDVPLGSTTRFSVGSLTKQFTAALVLHLQDRGLLDVQDSVGRYLPTFRAPITLHQLLNHTSGMPDYPRDPELRARMRNGLTPPDVLRWAATQAPAFPPGTEYAYSNTGYFLLGAIIESVTGSTYEEVLRQRIFAPAGMKHSSCQDFFGVQPRRATGYDRDDTGAVVLATPHAYSYAAGGIFSTAADLARWHTYLQGEKFLSPAARTAIFSDTGYGWEKASLAGQDTWEHTGYEPGFKASCVYVPEAELYVVALQNTEAGSATPFVLRTAALALGTPFPAWEEAPSPPPTATAFTGRFTFPGNKVREVRRQDDRLFWHSPGRVDQPLFFRNDSTLFFREGYRQLVFSPDYATVRYRGRTERIRGVRTGEVAQSSGQATELDPTALEAYVGDYRTEAFTVHIFRRAEELFAQPEGSDALALTPVGEGKFRIPAIGAELTFSAGELTILLDGQTLRGRRQ
ncbi:MAG: serine hydrolase domain-containing protein [Bacteroidota bacterium]